MKRLISLVPLIVLGLLAVSVAAGAGFVKPIVVQLGVHRFDRTSTGTIVARATPDQVIAPPKARRTGRARAAGPRSRRVPRRSR